MIRRILVPLDGSEGAEAVLGHAAVLARAFDAEIHLLQVLSRSMMPGGWEPVDPLAWRLSRARAGTYLSRVAHELREAEIRVRTEVREGVPSEVIVECLRKGRHHLVMLTTHGAGSRATMQVGGTAVAVALNAPASVMLIPVPAEGAPPRMKGYREILAPVDGSPRGDWALGVAAALAREAGARLQMVHVLSPPEILARFPEDPECARMVARIVEANRVEAERYMQEMKARLTAADLEVEGMVVPGKDGVPRSLERLATERDSDLLVLSAHGQGACTSWAYGGTSGRLLLSGRLPVLVLQDIPAAGPSGGLGTPE
jgi:nucleotide-binding universal stress UspA family protein